MSQAKVDRYKEEKANRKKILAKEKRKRIAGTICGWLIAYLSSDGQDTPVITLTKRADRSKRSMPILMLSIITWIRSTQKNNFFTQKGSGTSGTFFDS